MTTNRAFSKVGGLLCLDFTNTGSGRGTNSFLERLNNHLDIRMWAIQNELLKPVSIGDAVMNTTISNEALLSHVIETREVIYSALSNLSNNVEVQQSGIDFIQDAYIKELMNVRFLPSDGGYRWHWKFGAITQTALLGPILESAIQLLARPNKKTIEDVSGRGLWLFVL